MIEHLMVSNPGDVKPVRSATSELPIDHGPATGTIILAVEGHPNERSSGWWQPVIIGKTHRRCTDTLPSDQEGWMMKTKTIPYNIAETLGTSAI
jgi:hypothetical protein